MSVRSDLVPAELRAAWVDAGHTPGVDLRTLFDEQAKRHPDKVAVVDDEKSTTYAEIGEMADRIAGLLQRVGDRPGRRRGHPAAQHRRGLRRRPGRGHRGGDLPRLPRPLPPQRGAVAAEPAPGPWPACSPAPAGLRLRRHDGRPPARPPGAAAPGGARRAGRRLRLHRRPPGRRRAAPAPPGRGGRPPRPGPDHRHLRAPRRRPRWCCTPTPPSAAASPRCSARSGPTTTPASCSSRRCRRGSARWAPTPPWPASG